MGYSGMFKMCTLHDDQIVMFVLVKEGLCWKSVNLYARIILV